MCDKVRLLCYPTTSSQRECVHRTRGGSDGRQTQLSPASDIDIRWREAREIGRCGRRGVDVRFLAAKVHRPGLEMSMC